MSPRTKRLDLNNKSLGNVGDHPDICPVCSVRMCVKGWECYKKKNKVLCRACGVSFEWGREDE